MMAASSFAAAWRWLRRKLKRKNLTASSEQNAWMTLEQAWMLAWRTEVEPEQAWTQRESDALDLFHWHLMESERRPMAQ